MANTQYMLEAVIVIACIFIIIIILLFMEPYTHVQDIR